MRCTKCNKRAVFGPPGLCERHFTQGLEKRAHSTIKRFRLLGRQDRILVATSGGKDSLTCLHILSKAYQVEALAIDEGIKGYREHTLKALQDYCSAAGIKLHVIRAKAELGTDVDGMVKSLKLGPCHMCGAVRRYLLNRHARLLGADKLATGHNLDDEAQSVMMNMFKNQPELSARLGPVSGIVEDERFVPRVKPLYLCSEKETTAYAFLKGFATPYIECPYASQSYRYHVLTLLNE